ncbi:MAG: hypothetical protein ACLQNE_22200 [Thermoguttaceae bacterium]
MTEHKEYTVTKGNGNELSSLPGILGVYRNPFGEGANVVEIIFGDGYDGDIIHEAQEVGVSLNQM